MDLDRAHADSEIECDQLVRPARQQPVKNFPLARTESGDPPRGVGDIEFMIGAVFPGKHRLDRPEQGMIAVRLFQKVGCARLHRANGRLDIALTGHDNHREVGSHLEKLRLDIQSAHAWQADVEQDATRFERLRCRQKCVRMVERDRLEIGRTQQPFQRPQHGVVIIQNVASPADGR
jgi:hypothetical protein